MDQFKKKFLDSKLHRHFGQKSEKFNSIKNNSSKKEVSLYFDWLKEENAKDEFAKLNPAQKLSKEEIDEEVQVHFINDLHQNVEHGCLAENHSVENAF